MRPDFRSLEAFYWVAFFGNFRRAAERLNTTQPAISQRVAGLELDFNIKLFKRGSRAATLTPKGQELLNHVEQLLRVMSDLTDAIASPAVMSGVVRLGVAETLVHTWLPRFIGRLHAAYPRVTLDITVDVSPGLRAIADGRMDLGFLLGPMSDPGLINSELCSYPLAFVASPGLRLPPPDADGRYPLAALLSKPIITYPTTTRPYMALRQMLRRSGVLAPQVYSNSSLSTIVRMTLDQIGISVIPPVVIAPELARGELRLIETACSLPDLAFHAVAPVMPDGALVSPLVRIAQEAAQEFAFLKGDQAGLSKLITNED